MSNTQNQFKAEKISRTENILLCADIETVFPLFGAFEERKWAEGWNPALIYPDKEVIEEWTTFETEGREEEDKYLWRVSKYDTQNYLVQYLVSTENRYWVITVKCYSLEKNRTQAEVTYTYVGLNNMGNQLNKESMKRIFHKDLKNWEEAINSYLLKESSYGKKSM